MESSKMYYTSRCRYRANQCGAAKYPVSWGVVKVPEWNSIRGISVLQIPIVPCLYQSNGNIKRKLRALTVQRCITLVGRDTVLTSAGPQITPFHGG